MHNQQITLDSSVGGSSGTKMAENYLYENAPLVEVIVELRWNLHPIQSFPNAAIDINYDTFISKLTDNLHRIDYTHIEDLIPNDVPKEFLAHNVVRRFREKLHSWPVIQAGPGVFTINIVPPYNGWGVFKEIVENCISIFFESYPVNQDTFKFKSVELRYVDAFTKQHGLDNPKAFMKNELDLVPAFSNRLLDLAKEGPDSFLNQGVIEFPVSDLENSVAAIKYGTGTTGDKEAVILENRVTKTGNIPTDLKEVLSILDQSHMITNSIFEKIISDNIRQMMGEAKEIA